MLSAFVHELSRSLTSLAQHHLLEGASARTLPAMACNRATGLDSLDGGYGKQSCAA